MSKRTDSAVPHDDAVSETYRDLPPREPGAALDARVRALVQAELTSKAAQQPIEAEEAEGHQVAEVILLPPPRRNWTVPLAAAASFLGALTLGLWWFGGVIGPHEEKALLTFEETASEPAAAVVAQAEKPASVTAAPVVSEQPASELPASAPTVLAQADTATQPAPPVAAKAEQTPLPAAPAAAPPPAREAFSPSTPAEPAAAAAPSADSPAGASAPPDVALRKAAPTTAGTIAAPMAGNQAQAEQGASAAAAAKPARPAPTLESIRRLKRDAKEAEARAEFHRWLLRHPGAIVPEDLRGLLESGASSPAP